MAQWTGINVTLEDVTSTWNVDGVEREASINRISLLIEEKTEAELRVGATIGQASIRTDDLTGPTNIQRFDASFVGFYLRQPISFAEFFSLEGTLAYRYNIGSGNSNADPDEISWHQIDFSLAAGAQFGPIRIRPFIAWQNIDGDTEAESGREIFEADDAVSGGVQFDYFVESNAFIRFSVSDGNDETFSIGFAKVY